MRRLWVTVAVAFILLLYAVISVQVNSRAVSSGVQDDASKRHWSSGGNDPCAGKERFLEILRASGQRNITWEVCESIPTWETFSRMYGDEPVVYGTETCEAFRATIRELNVNRDGAMKPIEPWVRVAGLYNSGTNAFNYALQDNLEQLKFVSWHEVPWGKHLSPGHIKGARTYGPKPETFKQVLPVVLVRDPFLWMSSMCKNGYNAKWKRPLKSHCPNLVPTPAEKRILPSESFFRHDSPTSESSSVPTFLVDVRALEYGVHDKYDSLADMWTKFNGQYVYDVGFPRLVIRLEDAVFHASSVMDAIRKCAGVENGDVGEEQDGGGGGRTGASTGTGNITSGVTSFKYHFAAAKKHSNPSNLLGVMSQYGPKSDRFRGMTPHDLLYAAEALDPDLLRLLHYPDVPQPSRATANDAG